MLTHMEFAQATSGLRIPWSGPFGRTTHISLKEDMTCELSILLPSIGPP
jgi:hypothetical protein